MAQLLKSRRQNGSGAYQLVIGVAWCVIYSRWRDKCRFVSANVCAKWFEYRKTVTKPVT